METLPIQVLILTNQLIIISKIDEVLAADIGQPDCKLINPCIYENGELNPWISEITDETEMLISSDKILTLVEPNQEIVNRYLEITK